MPCLSRLARAAAISAVCALAATPVFAGSDAETLLAQLRKTYESTADLSARFVQTSHLVASGMDRTVSGTVVFQKGGRMRWSYEGDDPQVIVSDGHTLWIYQVRDKTVLRQPLADVPASSRVALDLLSGFEGVESAFEVTSCGKLCLELTPRKHRPDLARVVLELEPDAKGVREVRTEDALGNRSRVEFRDVHRNAGVPAGTFEFQVPEGVQVVEMPGANK